MIYLDNGATSFPKPLPVRRAVWKAMENCANPGRGGYKQAMAAAQTVYHCRESAAELFDCDPEQVVMTASCTQGLNTAIRSLVSPGDRVVVSGFEHNAVMRPLYALGSQITVAGRKLFDWEDTLQSFHRALQDGAQLAVFTHVSNVFGYILPIEELAELCRKKQVPFILDAAQSAGTLPVKLRELGARFIAMPGHKGLLGPQGTGLLLCAEPGEPLLYGGTGTASMERGMPAFLPERMEAGTLNVPGIAGLAAGIDLVRSIGTKNIFDREHRQVRKCIQALKKSGVTLFAGPHQASTLSVLPGKDCEEIADLLGNQGIAVRAGLHCAPVAHESAGTLETGTLRLSFGISASDAQTAHFLRSASKLPGFLP